VTVVCRRSRCILELANFVHWEIIEIRDEGQWHEAHRIEYSFAGSYAIHHNSDGDVPWDGL
jgi:hypothetical protein